MNSLKCIDTQIKKKINEINQIIAEHKETSFALCSSTLLYIIDNKMLEKNLEYIYKKINKINITTFSSGIVGVGWLCQYLLKKNLIDYDDVNELLVQIDEISYKSALVDLKENNHDFLHGSVGNAIYLSSRLEENKNVKIYLTEILNILSEISKSNNKGVYWEESTFYLKEYEKDKKIINLSLAHGIASKIVLFSKLYKQGIDINLSKHLLKESVGFLLNSKNPTNSISIFPTRVEENQESNYSRLSWCYGDLGISIALWQAGDALQDEIIKQEAIEICLYTTQRIDLKDTGLNDAAFCHGTAGVAHIYNRMFRYTRKIEFKEAANYWIEQTLKMATFEDGLAGYKSFFTEKYGGWVTNYGLLDGVTGIGLVLNSYINEEEPTWDECLLLS